MRVNKIVSVLVISGLLMPLQLPPYFLSEAIAGESNTVPTNTTSPVINTAAPVGVFIANTTAAAAVVTSQNILNGILGAVSGTSSAAPPVPVNAPPNFPSSMPSPLTPPAPSPPPESGPLPPVITPLIFDGEGASTIDFFNALPIIQMDGVAPLPTPTPPPLSIGDPLLALGPPGPSHPGPPIIAPLPPSDTMSPPLVVMDGDED